MQDRLFPYRPMEGVPKDTERHRKTDSVIICDLCSHGIWNGNLDWLRFALGIETTDCLDRDHLGSDSKTMGPDSEPEILDWHFWESSVPIWSAIFFKSEFNQQKRMLKQQSLESRSHAIEIAQCNIWWLDDLDALFHRKSFLHPITLWIYKVGPPSDVCWFISPSNYSYKYHQP